MIGFDFWVQLFVLLACLFYAAPRGGMTLGLMGGIGLIIFIFGFGLKPGKPPVDVILTIMAVVCAGATLQAAGGLDCLLSIAEKILRNHPRFVCYLAPYLCWFLTVLCGTGHQEQHPSGTPDGCFHDRRSDGRDLLAGCCGCCVDGGFA